MIEITNEMCEDLESASAFVEDIINQPMSVQFCTIVLIALILKEQINVRIKSVDGAGVPKDFKDGDVTLEDIFGNAKLIADALVDLEMFEFSDEEPSAPKVQHISDNLYKIH